MMEIDLHEMLKPVSMVEIEREAMKRWRYEYYGANQMRKWTESQLKIARESKDFERQRHLNAEVMAIKENLLEINSDYRRAWPHVLKGWN